MSKQTVPNTYASPWFVEIDLVAMGEKLRSKRLAADMSQESLSELFNQGLDSATRCTISNWENGRTMPSLLHLVFLAKLYSCSLDELVVYCATPCGGGRDNQLVLFYELYTISQEQTNNKAECLNRMHFSKAMF